MYVSIGVASGLFVAAAVNFAVAQELGEFVTAAPDWHVGDEFFTAERRRYRVIA